MDQQTEDLFQRVCTNQRIGQNEQLA